ncbi:MAG: RpoL/Rpb11 RNA polymerase subunit family protein [Candidatus Micrarchaeia archaeon]
MPISIIEDTPKSLVIEFEGIDRSVAELIASKLSESGAVEFAGVEKEHPETGKPRLVVKAEKSPRSLVEKAVEQAEKEIEELKQQMGKK